MQMAPFDEVLVDVTSQSPKLSTAGYDVAGRFPIIDQGASPAAGRIDDESLVTRVERPLILFGDHTRRFKLVEEDFVVGADGLKVLAVRPEHDARYVLHALRSISLPDAGYSRHFKYLRRAYLPIVSLEEQRRIAALLDQVDELRAKRRHTLALLEDLRESEIHQFVLRQGDAARPLAQVVPSISSGKSLVAGAAKAHPTARVLKISAVTTGQFRAAESKPLPETYDPPHSHLVRSGDLLVRRANTADLVGAAAVVRDEVSALYLPDKLWRLDLSSVSDKIFLWALLSSRPMRRQLSALATGSGGSMKNLSQKIFLEQLLPWPSVEQRAALVRIVEEIEASKSSSQAHLAKLDELFASLQHRAFTGQV